MQKICRRKRGPTAFMLPQEHLWIMVEIDCILPSDPTSNWRSSESGSESVKWATGHGDVGNQASHGNSATGITKKLWNTIRLGTWNVRGLLDPGKLAIVEKETSDTAITGIAETHWKGQGYFKSRNGNMVYFSGNENASRNGVAIIVNKSINSAVTGYEAVNDRIMVLKLNARPAGLNIIQAYAPTSASDDEDVEAFYAELEGTLGKMSTREITILMGDFNAKIGESGADEGLRGAVGRFGLGSRNERGERLVHFCADNSLFICNSGFQHHPRRRYTWRSPGGVYRNQIDYIMISSRWRTSIKDSKTYPGKDCGSDHQFLAAELKLKLKKLAPKKSARNRWSLKADTTYKSEAEKEVKKVLNNIRPTEDAEAVWLRSKNAMERAATRANAAPNVSNGRKPWISDDTWNAIQLRKSIKKTGLQQPETRQMYGEVSREIRRKCRKDKNQYLNNICAELEMHSDRNETKDMFLKLKQITRKFTPHHTTVRDDDGRLLTDQDNIKERWKSYCEKLFKDETLKNTSKVEAPVFDLEPDITIQEVQAALGKIKPNKAAGEDSVVIEMITSLGETGTRMMFTLCKQIWRSCKWPSDWTSSIYVPLHKKGAKDRCENYRTISLISHASKVMLQIILERLKPYLLPQIPEEQAGFMPQRGTREHILNMRQIIEKCREYNVKVYICFLDYCKAFDCVQWQRMWTILAEMGTPQHLITLIKNLYESSRAKVRVNADMSEPFVLEKGVRQGCILSPVLFNIYGEWIIRRATDGWKGGIAVGGRKLCNLRYADDTTLLATTEEELIELVSRVEIASNEVGLQINREKTKIMIVDRPNDNQREVTQISNIQVVDRFVYLGTLLMNTGGNTEEIKRRAGISKTAVAQLTKIWQSHDIHVETKKRLMKSLVFSVFMYASECWTIKKADLRRIDGFEMTCWRRMLRIPWTARRTNQSILKELKIKNRLSTIIRRRMLKYFGHTIRKDGLEKLMLQGRVEGSRNRGRSPTRYTDVVMKATNTSLMQCMRMAEDRNTWGAVSQSAFSETDS